MTTRSFVTILVIFIYVFTGSECPEPKEKVNSSFVATNQWKKIEEGQAISPGLHVRINLKTGEKEAKLMDSDNHEDNSKKSLIATGKEGEDEASGASSTLSPEELKKMLKKIKPDEDTSNKEAFNDGVKKKFRSYEKLKEEFSKLELEVKSDYEILVDLLDDFKKFNLQTPHSNNVTDELTSDEDIISTLVDLEYLVHQINNAQDFARLNGFSDVIYKSLNSTNSEIRSLALNILGSATQNNIHVKIAALKSGSINLLVKILTFDESINVRARSLYALSCLIRSFPVAQEKFIADGGLTAFAKVFDQEKQNLFKLQVKVITLLHDLLFERKDIKVRISNGANENQTDTEIENLRQKLRQYEKMNLEQKLVEQDWCKRISNWFLKENQVKDVVASANSGITSENFNSDVISGVVETLYVLSDICKSDFQSDVDLIVLLMNLRDVYKDLAEEEAKDKEDTTNFYSGLSNILKMLLGKITDNSKKDEL